MPPTSPEHNHYRTLGVRVGAPIWEVEDAAARLIFQAASVRDYFRLEQLEEARHWLTTPALRVLHDEKLDGAIQ